MSEKTRNQIIMWTGIFLVSLLTVIYIDRSTRIYIGPEHFVRNMGCGSGFIFFIALGATIYSFVRALMSSITGWGEKMRADAAEAATVAKAKAAALIAEQAKEKERQRQEAEARREAFIKLCKTGTAQEVEDAIKAGADVNTSDSDGMTALMYAAGANKRPEVAAVLLKNKADVHAKDSDGMTALMYVASANATSEAPEVIETLVKNGAKINEGNSIQFGLTPLFYATMGNTPEIIVALIKNGADVNAREANGWTALIHAAASNKNPNVIDVIDKLVKNGAEIDARDLKTGRTALIMAAGSGENPEVIGALVRNKADVNARQGVDESERTDGITALMLAAYMATNLDMITALLDNGADTKLESGGRMAIDFALDNKRNITGTAAYKKLRELSPRDGVSLNQQADNLIAEAERFLNQLGKD